MSNAPDRGRHPDTLAVTAGRPRRSPDAPLNQPIVPASTYVAGPDPDGVGYGRYGNPGWTALEDAVGALEGGSALAYGSGMAAAAAVLELIPPDGVLVLGEHCYLGVAGLAAERAERDGLTVRTADLSDAEALRAAASGAADGRAADLVWLETPANPTMEVADIAGLAAELPADCLLLVDNTLATPVLQRPLESGADIVLHSATKFLSGHSDALCGMLIFAGSATEQFGRAEAYRRLHGAVPGALECYLVLRGIRTLPLRVRQAERNARALIPLLEADPLISRVRYPGYGSMLAVEFADAATADAVIDRLQVWLPATSLGGVESTLERRRRWPAELTTVAPGLVRMSVGIEHVDDLIADLEAALH